MLFFQSAMQRRGIPYLIVCVNVAIALERELPCASTLGAYRAKLDTSRISRQSIRDPEIAVDSVVGHPGPTAHHLFAHSLLDEFGDRLLAPPQLPEAQPDASSSKTVRVYADGASASRASRLSMRVAARREAQTVHLTFGDGLLFERFDQGKRVEVDIERPSAKRSANQIARACASYANADIIRCENWMALLMAQEYRSCPRTWCNWRQ